MADIYDNNENLMLNLSVAQQINPDLAGEAQRLSQETGIPPDVAQNNIEEARKQAKMRQAQALKLSKLDPILARQLEDPSFAAIAHDQLEPLTGVGKVFNWFGSPSDISKGYDIGQMQQDASVLKYEKRIGAITPEQSAKLGSLESQLKALTEGRPEPGVFGQTGEVIGQMSRTMPEAIKAGLYTAPVAGGIAVAAGPLSPITVPAATIGGFIAGMGSSVLKQTQHTESAEVYEDMIAEGVDEQTALYASAGVGLVNGVLEAANVGVLASPFKKALSKLATEEIATLLTKPTMKAALREFGVSYGKAVASETATELSQEFTSIAGEEIAKQISKPELESKLSTPEGQKEIAQRLGSVVEQTIKGMVFLAAPGPAINFRMDMKRVDDAKRDAQFIDALTQQSVDSVVRKRNPDAWESFIANQAENGPAKNFYIEAQQFQNVLNQQGLTKEQLSASLPDVASQVGIDVPLGGDVVIPTSVYAAKIAGTDFGNALKPHMRIDENGISITEALDIESQKEELKKNAQAVLEEKMARDQAFIDSAKDVEKQLFSQIKETGTYRDKVSKDFATFVRDFVVTQSADLGVLPSDFYEDYKLKIAKAQEQQDQFQQQGYDQAGNLQTDTEAFKNWFGESKVVNTEGKPMVLYHGTDADFTEFNTGAERINRGNNPEGVYLTPDENEARGYGKNVMTLYAKAENTYVEGTSKVNQKMAEKYAEILKNNYPSYGDSWVDSVLVPEFVKTGKFKDIAGNFKTEVMQAGGYDSWKDGRHVVVFSPTQVKSAIGNSGAFDSNNPNILKQGETQAPRLMAINNLSADNLLFADKMGGIAVPSIGVVTNKAGGVEGFGEITLIGTKDLANPSNEPVFSSDAYTARFPRPEWPKAKQKDAQRLVNEIQKIAKEFDDSSLVDMTWDEMVNHPNADKVIDRWINTLATQAMFLREQGITVEPVISPIRPQTGLSVEQIQELRPLLNEVIAIDREGENWEDSPQGKELTEKSVSMLREKLTAEGKRPGLINQMVDNLTKNSLYYLRRDSDIVQRGETVDSYETRLQIQPLIDERAIEFKKWVEDKVLPNFGEPFLKVAGKKAPYTLDNIVKAMTGPKVRGQEKTMTYGAGNVRAASNVQFFDIEQMRKAAEQAITDPDDYIAAKAASDELLDNYRTAVVEFTLLRNWRNEPDIWDAMDGSMRALAKWSTGKKRDAASMKAALKSEEFDVSRISENVIQQAMDAGNALLKAPVPYFEAKPQRAVRLDEFAGAVIPENASEKVREVLDKNGIPFIEYTNEGQRNELARSFAAELSAGGKETLFQQNRGGFDPESLTILLTKKTADGKGADYSTFLHESAHFFLTAYSDLAAKPNATERMKADMQTLLDWFGVSDLETWNAMSLDQQRKYHEQFAYNFELYLFEGKAPNTKLQAIFDNFSRWLKRVYISIRDDLNALYREENGEDLPILTGEVRQVMDRMIASDEQIAQAEQINNMKGIYQSQEQSGMDDNAWAAYQEMIKEARDAGVTELTKATLRQMKWLSDAQSHVLKEMQATANAQRREVRADVRMEVLARPIYRAYVALTAKITGEDKITPIAPRKSDPNVVDPTMDSLAMAIAKLGGLDKQELIEEWGIDPKYNPASGVFGKPVLRLSGGLSRETMAEHLVDLGYLSFDKNGRYDLQEFEQKLDEQLRGRDQYSMQYYPEAEMRAGDQIINPAALMAMRFDSVELALLHLPEEVINVIQSRNMVAKDGLHPDIVASLFGFSSGDELVRQLAEVPPPKEAIETLTDQRMLEEYSELSDPKAMEDEVQKALHNEARARFVAVELRYLAKATAPVRVMMNAAKQVAKQILSNKKLSEIKPREYTSAEARAAKQAETFMKKGQSQEAQKAKQNQLVQNQLAAEALAAKAEVMKSLQSFKKVFKADDKLAKTRNMDLVNVCRSILSFYGIGAPKGKSPTEFVEKLRTYNAEMYAEIEPLIMDAATGQKQFTDLTLDEFRSLRDTIESLWFQSRREHEIMIEGKLIDKQIAIDALNSRLEEIGIPEEIAGERMAPSNKERMFRSFNNTKAMLRRIEHWADATDGAAGVGPFTTYIFRPIRQALSKYRNLRNDYVKRYAESIATLSLPVAKIESPPSELNYTFGNNNGNIGKAELLGALLHRGNASNFKKLLLGRKWGELNADGSLNASRWMAFEKRMQDEGILTKADYDWLQSVWDLCEEMKPLAQKAHHDIFGYYFKEIEYSPVVTPWGVYKGGYVPASPDPFLVRDARINAKLDELEGDFRNSMPSTGYGFTKNRVDKYNKPLSLDIRTMTKHIDDVIRFAMVQPAIKDVLGLIKSRSFADNLTRIDPSAIETMLLPWLNRAARNITTEAGRHKDVDKIWSYVRSNVGISIMFANITNALQQLTGYFPAMLKVNKTYLKEALISYMSSTQKVTEEVAEMSEFMKSRLSSQMFDIQDNINELLLNPSKFDKVRSWSQHHGYFLQTAFQNQVDIVTWTATYNQTLAELGADVDDKQANYEAIQRADAAVSLTQGSLSAEDISAFEVGSPFYKTLIQFAGYFNMLANLNVSEYVKLFRDMGWRGNKGKLFMVYMLGFGLPMLVSDAIVRSLGGQWDDEDDDGYIDEFMEWFFGSQIKGAVALAPFGTVATGFANAFNDKVYDDRLSISPAIRAIETATYGLVKTGFNIAEGNVEGKNIRDTLTFLSLATGTPLTILGRPTGYAVDVEHGKINPTSTADFARGLITGKASEESQK